jgi:hypothetical protein
MVRVVQYKRDWNSSAECLPYDQIALPDFDAVEASCNFKSSSNQKTQTSPLTRPAAMGDALWARALLPIDWGACQVRALGSHVASMTRPSVLIVY